jgi:DNA-binding SARP family transcriptional activator
MLEFKLLGPLEVRNGDSVLALGGAKQRALLAVLLLHANEVLSRDRLIDELWGETASPSAGHRLEGQISRLRKSLDLNGGLATKHGGYALEVDPMRIDSYRFERLLEEGRGQAAAGMTAAASDTLRQALSLWRGDALADLAYDSFARSEIERLEELRVAAIEERIDADLALGRHQALVAELEALAAKHPLRERLRGQLMLVLYRSGRQAEALEVYQEFRRALSEQLGLDPGPGLQQLELAILRRDPTLDPPVSAADAEASVPGCSSSPRSASGVRRRPLVVVVVVSVLLAFVLAGVVMASSGGRRGPPSVIPGDAVGAISPGAGSLRAVVPLGTSPSAVVAGAGGVWVADATRGRCRGSTRARARSLRRWRWARRRAGSRSAAGRCGSRTTTTGRCRGSILRSIGSCRRSPWVTRRQGWRSATGRCGWPTRATGR